MDGITTREIQQLQQIQTDMAQFEAQYGMSSEDFYQRWQGGEMDDRMDFVEWASLYQMAQNLKERLALLELKSES